jgi:ferredoxin--NADP+ reductase
VALDPVSEAWLAGEEDQAAIRKKLDLLQDYARRSPTGKPRHLSLRFLLSPTEILGDDRGHVAAIRMVRNRLVDRNGGIAAESTGEVEEMSAGLVFRSVGYKGVPVAGLPFDDRKGTVPHEAGRVVDAGKPVAGCYVAGWIKRGPSGVIGTNKPCAAETAEAMLADAAAGRTLAPEGGDIEPLLRSRQPDVVTWADWLRINEDETARGKAAGRSRVKRTTVAEMLAAARRE